MSKDMLHSVHSYIKDVRVILLDKIHPYRYRDDELLTAFNTSLLEGRRLRPDLFVYKHGNRVPHFEAVDGEEVPIEPQFRLAFVYGTAAMALIRDEEDVQDARAASFRAVFESILTGLNMPRIQGGTPGKAVAAPPPGQ